MLDHASRRPSGCAHEESGLRAHAHTPTATAMVELTQVRRDVSFRTRPASTSQCHGGSPNGSGYVCGHSTCGGPWSLPLPRYHGIYQVEYRRRRVITGPSMDHGAYAATYIHTYCTVV